MLGLAFIPVSATRVCFSALAGIIFGAAVAQPYIAARDSLARSVGKEVVVTGTVAEVKIKNGSPRLKIDKLSINYSTSVIKSQIFVTLTPGSVTPNIGDKVSLRGVLKDGFSIYGAAIYRAKVLSLDSSPQSGGYG